RSSMDTQPGRRRQRRSEVVRRDQRDTNWPTTQPEKSAIAFDGMRSTTNRDNRAWYPWSNRPYCAEGTRRSFVSFGSEDCETHLAASSGLVFIQTETPTSSCALRASGLPIVCAHASAVCGSVAISFCTREVTPASRDLPSGKVCNHAPAAERSLCDQRLIKLSQARSRFAPSGKEAVHLPADWGSVAAQFQTIPLVAFAWA